MSDEVKWHWAEGTKYVLEGGKCFFIANGAAAISILTFIGNGRVHPKLIAIAMILFAAGAMCSALIFLFAYVTQLYYGNDNSIAARRWHLGTYAVVIIGFILFIIGIGLSGCSFLNEATVTQRTSSKQVATIILCDSGAPFCLQSAAVLALVKHAARRQAAVAFGHA